MTTTPTTDALRAARDKAQTEYAHTKQRALTGHASRAQLTATRYAYMRAQDEYRDALIADRRVRVVQS
jgi:hypothetical protein